MAPRVKVNPLNSRGHDPADRASGRATVATRASRQLRKAAWKSRKRGEETRDAEADRPSGTDLLRRSSWRSPRRGTPAGS